MINIKKVKYIVKKYTPDVIIINSSTDDIFHKNTDELFDTSHPEISEDDNFYDVVAVVRDMVLNSNLNKDEIKAIMDGLDKVCDAHGNDLTILKKTYNQLNCLNKEYYEKMVKRYKPTTPHKHGLDINEVHYDEWTKCNYDSLHN